MNGLNGNEFTGNRFAHGVENKVDLSKQNQPNYRHTTLDQRFNRGNGLEKITLIAYKSQKVRKSLPLYRNVST